MVRMISIFAVLSLGTGLDGLEESRDGIWARGGIEELERQRSREKRSWNCRDMRLKDAIHTDVEARTLENHQAPGTNAKKPRISWTVY